MAKFNSIIQKDEDKCFICGKRYNLEVHHCLHGTANRKLADKYHLVVKLCEKCHYILHNQDKTIDKYLETIAQQAFEKVYSHDKFIKTFGKNYL